MKNFTMLLFLSFYGHKSRFWFLFTWSSVLNNRGYILNFPFSFNAKLHHHTLSGVLYLCLSSVDIMTDLDSYYCFQSPSPSKVIGQNPKVVLGFHFVRGSAACGVNNNLVGVLQLLHNGHSVNLL